ncbi:MAG: PLP-dependent aminotransferase family protein [Microscillaceae bacterium]|jgi:GntR family transcriptional regulator/MocR family aminotransferase|nr:PLP-dependent aminotransferase family protein [Microscillaceae bacterium]
MLPYKTLIEIDRHSAVPVYLQISNNLIMLIKRGVLPSGAKLPGTRRLADILAVHRQTAVRAYEELYTQGWLEQIAAKGTFVSRQLPEIRPQKLKDADTQKFVYPQQTGYVLPKNEVLNRSPLKALLNLGFDDGFPDVRLAPWDILMRQYRGILHRSFQKHLLSYSDTLGNAFLREQLAFFLQQTRGLAIQKENLLITRGCIMGIHLVAQTLLRPSDRVAVAQLGYVSAEMIFRQAGADLVCVPLDENGIQVEALAKICRQKPIKLLYITPHHHYPTTVTLSAERRIQLLQLADRQGFIILEDDYDYDYHYTGSPILPLASADTNGMVVYVGSLSKVLAPAVRVGYVVAPVNLIEELANLRRIIDRQGDTILEQAVGELIAEGELKRHLKKVQKIYQQRRELFGDLLQTHCANFLDFKLPQGGMAVWADFAADICLQDLALAAHRKGLYIGNGTNYSLDNQVVNSSRLGFANLNEAEMSTGVVLLKKIVGEL